MGVWGLSIGWSIGRGAAVHWAVVAVAVFLVLAPFPSSETSRGLRVGPSLLSLLLAPSRALLLAAVSGSASLMLVVTFLHWKGEKVLCFLLLLLPLLQAC